MTNLTLKRYILKSLNLYNYKGDYRLNKFPDYLKYVLIGLLLSDGGLQRSTETSNVRLSLIMSVKSFPYFLHLYNLFEPYINTDLNILDIKALNQFDSNKIYSTVRFKTISMPQLAYYYNIFYKKNYISNNWEKVVPIELKSSFNEISLAHLIMGDGNYLKNRDIIRIYTNSFTKNNVKFLSNILSENLLIDNKVIHDRNNQYIIIIEKEYIDLVKDLTLSYMHPFMLYKLGIDTDLNLNKKFDYLNIINDI